MHLPKLKIHDSILYISQIGRSYFNGVIPAQTMPLLSKALFVSAFTQCICSVFLHWVRFVSLQMFQRHFTSFFNVIFMLKRAHTIIWPTFPFIIIFVHSILVYYCIYQYIDILDKSLFILCMITDVVWFLELGTQVHLNGL